MNPTPDNPAIAPELSPGVRYKRRCSLLTVAGEPCRAWAIRGSEPPVCAAHSIRDGDQATPRPGFFSQTYTLEEVADLVDGAYDEGVEQELVAARVAVRRVMEQLREELSADDYARLAALVFRGANTIARLLRAKRVITDPSGDAFSVDFAQALDDLSVEWDVEL